MLWRAWKLLWLPPWPQRLYLPSSGPLHWPFALIGTLLPELYHLSHFVKSLLNGCHLFRETLHHQLFVQTAPSFITLLLCFSFSSSPSKILNHCFIQLVVHLLISGIFVYNVLAISSVPGTQKVLSSFSYFFSLSTPSIFCSMRRQTLWGVSSAVPPLSTTAHHILGAQCCCWWCCFSRLRLCETP